jgi:uncharacterized protein (TIGR03437 family)
LNPTNISLTTIRIGNNWWEPIQTNRTGQKIFINLYCTGLRYSDGTFPATDKLEVIVDDLTIIPTYVGLSGFQGVEQVQFELPPSLAGSPRAVNLRVRVKYTPTSFLNGSIEWGSRIPDFTTSGRIVNQLQIPIM